MTSQIPEAPAPVPRRRFRMSGRTWLIVALAVVLLGGVGVGSFLLLRPNRGAGGQSFSRTAEATLGTQTHTVSVDGTLSPRKQSNLNYAVSGTVTKVYVKAGDTVAKNQKLARIDDSSLQDEVDVAQANLDAAEANLDEVQDNGGSDSAVNAASAGVDSAEATLASAKENLTDAVLRSPIAGTVASVGLEVGDTVGTSSSGSGTSSGSAASGTSGTTSSAEFVVISTAKWKLEGSVGAADLGSIKAGQEAKVTVNGTEVDATVASVGIVATSTSDGAATFPVVLNLSGTHDELFSGTTASGVITTGSYPDVLTVPTAAITTSDGRTVVTVVTDAGTSSVEVEIGKVFGSYTEITSGLSAGDQVQITFARPSSTSSSGSQEQGGGFGAGGLGGLAGGGGGGAPPDGGGAPPGGGGGNR